MSISRVPGLGCHMLRTPRMPFNLSTLDLKDSTMSRWNDMDSGPKNWAILPTSFVSKSANSRKRACGRTCYE